MKSKIVSLSKNEEFKSIPIDQVITLDHLTNPEKK